MKKDKLFYVALGLGIVTLCSALAVYNHNNTKEPEQSQMIDLNKDDAVVKNTDTEDVQLVFDAEDTKKQATTTEDTKETANPSSEVQETKETGNTSGQPALDYDGMQSLKWPVEGNVILPFSMETTVYYETMDQYQCNPGMLIATKEGTAVLAAEDGKVVSVSDDPKLGKMIKVELGNGYVVTYGQLADVQVKEGGYVVKGTQIASVAKPTKFFEKEGSHLYMQIDKDDEPLDPLTVLE